MMYAVLVTLLAMTAQTLGNFSLSAGLKGAWKWWPVGVLLLAVHFFSWCYALTLAPLSKLVPLTALSHVLNAALAKTLLGEEVSAQRWLGTCLIVGGILVVLP